MKTIDQDRPWRQRRPRCQLIITIGFLELAISMVMLASAFAPPSSIGPARGSAREAVVLAMKSKKRRKRASAGDRVEREESTTNDKNVGDEADEGDGAAPDEIAPKQTTLSGGASLIFEMARRMLVWDDELYESQILNDAGSREGISASEKSPTALPSTPAPRSMTSPSASSSSTALPRWRPSAIEQQSISNVNPAFRTSSPVMTSAGYAGILRRNSRKKNKPSMWRHCLRIYGKMAKLGEINPTAVHHEAALVAASKLGMWEEALLIFRWVEEKSLPFDRNDDGSRKSSPVTDNMISSVISACVRASKVRRTATISTPPTAVNAGIDGKNEDSAINATITGKSTESSSNVTHVPPPLPPRPSTFRVLTAEERRKPLDMARAIIISMEERHGIPPVSRHINPLASAYVRLGLRSDAASLINDHLEDRESHPSTPKRSPRSKKFKQRWDDDERKPLTTDNLGFGGVQLVGWSNGDLLDENRGDGDGYGGPQLDVRQTKEKDLGSYSLLVQGAAMEGDWTGAVRELQRMTDAGLHPNSRNLNSWAEAVERGCRPSGNGNKNRSDLVLSYHGDSGMGTEDEG